MTSRVLIADDDRHIRELLADTLSDAGYDVIEALNGTAALEMAFQEAPDLILLDVMMPGMDGFQVLEALRDAPSTRDTPVVLLTVMSAIKGEAKAMDLGVSHYITKPWEWATVEAAVKVALYRAVPRGRAGDEGIGPREPAQVLMTGKEPLDKILDGGLPLRSLTLVEGMSSTGKSVLCYHLAHRSLEDGRGVAYFVSDTPQALVARMAPLGMDVLPYYQTGKLAIHPIDVPAESDDDGGSQDPERLMVMLGEQIERLPSQYRVVICDDVTDLASHCAESALMTFFMACKRACDRGFTIVVSARSYAFSESVLKCLQATCDSHLSIQSERIGAKIVSVMEVRKLRNAVLHRDNTLSFEVASHIGLRPVPGGRVRV